MQGLSSKTVQSVPSRRRQPARLGLEAGSVGRVAEERMTGMGEMDANLMGAAGFQPAFDQTGRRFPVRALESLQHLPVGDGGASLGAHRHPVAALGVPVDRLVDGALRARRGAPLRPAVRVCRAESAFLPNPIDPALHVHAVACLRRRIWD